MSDIGFSELLLLLAIALIVIGPQRLPEAARFLGYWIGRLRRTLQHARRDMERDLGIEDVRREVHNQLLLEELEKERREVEASFRRTLANPPPSPKTSQPPPSESDFIDDPPGMDDMPATNDTPAIDQSPTIDQPPAVDRPPAVDHRRGGKPAVARSDSTTPAPRS